MGITQNKVFIRNVMGEYMAILGSKDSRVTVVNSDLMGTCRNRPFVEAFPERSYNVGVAEQNMVSFSAGLAHEGFKVYAFSMAPFISMRACEQCRTDVAYANANVCLLAPYAGVSGGISGATHWAVEDCAIMCGMAGMTVMEPCDEIQAKKMLDATLEHTGPIYIRSSVEPVTSVYDDSYEFQIGKASVPLAGNDGAFICGGITVKYALEAAKRIREKTGKAIRVVDMHTIKPIDRAAICSAAETGRIVVAQDHSVIGGLGSAVASVLVEEGIAVKYANVGIPDRFRAMAHAPYLYHEFGFDADGLEAKMLQLLGVEVESIGG